MTEIRGGGRPGVEQLPAPTPNPSAAAEQVKTTPATSVHTQDSIGPVESRPDASAPAGLAEISAPTVSLDGDNVSGAQSFASQLGALADDDDGGNITTAFLKLNVDIAKKDLEWDDVMAEARHIMRKQAISISRKMNQNQASLSYDYAQAMNFQIQQSEARSAEGLQDQVEKIQEAMKKVLEGEMEVGEEKKKIDEDKLKRKFAKGSKGAMLAMMGGGADAGGVGDMMMPGMLAMAVGGGSVASVSDAVGGMADRTGAAAGVRSSTIG